MAPLLFISQKKLKWCYNMNMEKVELKPIIKFDENKLSLEREKDFLQSEAWRQFQESAGHQTFFLEDDNLQSLILEHQLPLVGNYFYLPRGPLRKNLEKDPNSETFSNRLLALAKKERVGWIRIEPKSETVLNSIKASLGVRMVKAPHETQPQEVFILDLSRPESELFSNMKPKTRYNIRLAEKKGVLVITFCLNQEKEKIRAEEYIGEFIRLTRLTAGRKKIKFHTDEYYRQMIKNLPGEILKIYIAKQKNQIIAANLVVFYGKTATYLHGAADHQYRNLMAPYLLHWQAIKDAKKQGFRDYDFGGIKSVASDSWEGITRFKLSFSEVDRPIKYPGNFDIILDRKKYCLYKLASGSKNFLKFKAS